ncbi:MAG: YqgE/AlgH family protein, partial [Acidithiobacillus ferriphilus]
MHSMVISGYKSGYDFTPLDYQFLCKHYDRSVMTFSSLKNHLLIAMPELHDGVFDRAVIVVCEHNAEGAMGVVINRLV